MPDAHDTETLAEVLAAHQWVWRTFQQRSFLACQCGDELIPATSSGVATLADHRNHVADALAAHIVQARAGEGALREACVLEPAENMALTVAWAQVERGEHPMGNVAAVCVMALERIRRAAMPSIAADPS